MALGAPSPVEHPGRNLPEAVCLRTVQSAAEKHAIGLLDDRVNPHLVRKPGMMRVQNLTPDGLVGVLKPCCTMAADRIRALTAALRIKLTSTSRHSAWRPNPADAPLIDAEILFRQPGPALSEKASMRHCGMEILPGDVIVNNSDEIHQRTGTGFRLGSVSMMIGELV